MVPIIGLDNSNIFSAGDDDKLESAVLGGEGTFAATQPLRLVKAIAGELGIRDCEYPLDRAVGVRDG
jgi:aminopeptidase I